jgi:hypothetical protein
MHWQELQRILLQVHSAAEPEERLHENVLIMVELSK